MPDLDGLGMLVSAEAYERYHHVVGHNVFAGIALTLGPWLVARGWNVAARRALRTGEWVNHWR